ncbi:MAG: low molecular weight protein arginine phosphatase [Anaerolineae bacterium]
MPAKRTVLFVCTGNVCRSPMAAGFFYDKLVQDKMDGCVRVRSAGIWALEGQPASAYALQVMGEHGLDISAHRGRNLTQADVEEADLILVMTKRHAEIIARDFPSSAGKVHLLSEMAGESYDIQDPYGGSLLEYRRTAAELANLIEQGYAKIMKWLRCQPSSQ